MSTFTAKFRGECPKCGHDVKDQECVFAAFDEVIHVKCPTGPEDLELVRPVCPVHFTELPVSGVCGECE